MNLAILGSIAPFIVVVDVIGVVAFTAMGIGPLVYNAVADATMNQAGNAAAAAAGGFMALLFVLDFYLMPILAQMFFGTLLVGFVFAAAILKGIVYPWAPGLLCIALPIIYMGWLRGFVFRPGKVTPAEFLWPAAMTFSAAFVAIMFAWLIFVFGSGRNWSEETKLWLTEENNDVFAYLWSNGTTTLNYTIHCSNSKNVSHFSNDEQAILLAACTSAANVWFLQWTGPFVLAFCNFVTALFVYLFMHVSRRVVMVNGDGEADSLPYLKQILKGSVLVIVLMLAAMYAAASYVSGSAVQLGSAVFCLGAVIIAGTLGWMYVEIDPVQLKRLASEGTMAENLLKVLRSDWVRAVAVACLNVLIPLMVVLDRARQCMRRARGTAENPADKFTPSGRRVANECSTWNWCSILSKVLLLGELFVALLLGMKATYVFFSWLNAVLGAANINFWVLCGYIFVIGLGMFLCPIVPGSAVYLFAGVVLGAQSQLPERPGFMVGVAAAIVVSSVAKHIACVGQYMIGYCAGQSVKVQQMVGVDQVGTRATEKILKQPGLSLGKVCILVAGPDFPTSMLCGILKLQIPKMLLGTTPVIFVSIIPQVLVGALLTYQGAAADDDSSSIESMISTAVTGFAAAAQAGATLLFTWRIMKTVEQDGEELSQPRPEHAAVAALTAKEADYRKAFHEVSKWDAMTCLQQTIVLWSVFAMLLSGFLIAADFMLAEKFCFRKFDITSNIKDPFELGGLDNNVINLVIVPIGWMTLVVVICAVAGHVAFSVMMGKAARGRLSSLKHQAGSPKDAQVIGKSEPRSPEDLPVPMEQ